MYGPTWRGKDRGRIIIHPEFQDYQRYIVDRVAKVAFHLGYRYRKYASELPGTPHIFFPKYKSAIFICDCRPLAPLSHYEGPTHKPQDLYWDENHSRTQAFNRRRLELIISALAKHGVRVMTLYRCELRDNEYVGDRIRSFLHSGVGADAPPTSYMESTKQSS